MEHHHKMLKVGISVGDLNGISLEVIIKTFMEKDFMQLCTPVVYASQKVIAQHKKALGFGEFNFSLCTDAAQAKAKHPNLINVWEEEVELEIGKETEIAGKYALLSLEAACKDLKAGKIDVLVTAPLNKHNVKVEGTIFTGHTQFLHDYFEAKNHLMIMVGPDMRLATLTEHMPLSKVPGAINDIVLKDKVRLLHQSLIRDFGIRKPKIAVLGLNPHNGDQGLMGDEEQKIIGPAIRKLNDDGMLVYGPYPADGFFGKLQFKEFDAVLCMYHDQGLSVFKALQFECGVNYTAGLPVVRTSPDHGVAYDIAGHGKADTTSFKHAVYTAIDIYRKRLEFDEISENPLKINVLRRERH
jgi:4-hydroxythreonine-4-phosphate dehydrogenase